MAGSEEMLNSELESNAAEIEQQENTQAEEEMEKTPEQAEPKKRGKRKTAEKVQDDETVKEETKEEAAPIEETEEEELEELEYIPEADEEDESAESGEKTSAEDITKEIDIPDNDIKDLLIQLLTSRRGTIKTANKSDRNKMYHGEAIFNPDGEDISSQEKELQSDYRKLRDASRANPPKYMRGVISGITSTTGGDERLMFRVKADRLHGFYEIKIPVEMMFEVDPKMPKDQLLNKMRRRLGARIKFCIKYVDEKEKICYASRLLAMQVEANAYYKRLVNGVPRIVEGSLINARIIGFDARSVVVDVYGGEAVIRQEELDWIRRGDVYDEYEINQMIPVRITKIEKAQYKPYENEEPFNLVHVEASRKQAISNPNVVYWNNYHEGDLVTGIVKQKNEGGMSLIIDDRVSAFSGFPPFMEEEIEVGDTVRCEIMRMVEKDHFIQVNITR